MKSVVIVLTSLAASVCFMRLAVKETLAANVSRQLAIAYQAQYESLARTMHGTVTPNYVCRAKAATTPTSASAK